MTGMPNAVCECGEWCPWVKTFSMLRMLNQINAMTMDVTVFVILGFMYLCKPLYPWFVKKFGEMD